MGTDAKTGFFSKIKDHDSLLQKLLTYGVAIVLVIICALSSPGEGGEINPALGWLIIGFLFYYALMSQRILETLFFGCLIGVALMYGTGLSGGLIDALFANMGSEDFVWAILLVGLLGVLCKLLARAGSLDAFAKIVTKRVKNEKQLKIWTWLIQFPLFFDDYMHMAMGSKIMMPLYDKYKVPREEGAFIIQATAMPLRVLFPVTSWLAFVSGAIASGGVDGMSTFLQTIPFSFYSWVCLIGTLLFALGVIPNIGAMKHSKPELYMSLDTEDDEISGKGTLFDFFLPIVASVVVAFFSDWDLVPALVIVTPLTFLYYLIRGIIKTDDIEDCLTGGFKDYLMIFILFALSYVLGGLLNDMGYIDYLVQVGSGSMNPHLLPFLLFVLFGISEAAMSLNWTLMLIAFPVVIPLAQGIGANVPLTASAVISAGALGYTFCYICDATNITAGSCGLPSAHKASTAVPYVILFAAITAVLYLIAGFIF